MYKIRTCSRGLIMGLVVAVCAAGLAIAQQQQPQQQQQPAAKALPAEPVGTYQVSAWAHDDGRHGAFVVNTRTGEVMSIVGRSRTVSEGPEGVYNVAPVQP